MSVSFKPLDSSQNIVGIMNNDQSFTIEFNDSVVNKIKSFKNFKSKRTSKFRMIKGIPHISTNSSSSDYFIGVDGDSDNIGLRVGLMSSDTLRDCNPNHLIPYIYIHKYTSFSLYGQIRVSILKNNKTYNSCFVDIDTTKAKNDLYICYDYVSLNEIEKWKDNDKYKLLFTMHWFSYDSKDNEMYNELSDIIKQYSSYVEDINDTEMTQIPLSSSTTEFMDICNRIEKFDWTKVSEINYDSLQSKSIEQLDNLQKNIESLKQINGAMIEDKKASEKVEEHLLCHICCSQKINTVFIPCGHMVCCEGCSKQASKFIDYNYYSDSDAEMIENDSGVCPMCKKYVNTIQKVYLD